MEEYLRLCRKVTAMSRLLLSLSVPVPWTLLEEAIKTHTRCEKTLQCGLLQTMTYLHFKKAALLGQCGRFHLSDTLCLVLGQEQCELWLKRKTMCELEQPLKRQPLKHVDKRSCKYLRRGQVSVHD